MFVCVGVIFGTRTKYVRALAFAFRLTATAMTTTPQRRRQQRSIHSKYIRKHTYVQNLQRSHLHLLFVCVVYGPETKCWCGWGGWFRKVSKQSTFDCVALSLPPEHTKLRRTDRPTDRQRRRSLRMQTGC